jgi:hypothetical protein
MMSLISDVPPSAPDPAGAGIATDRLDCGSWTLQASNPPISITARSTLTTREQPARKTIRPLCGQPASVDRTFVRHGPIALPGGILHARATGAVDRSGRLVADAAVFVQESTKVELIVPPGWRDKFTLGGRNGERSDRLIVPRCKFLVAYGWNLSLNSFWIDEPACAPLIVKTHRSTRTIHLPIGTPCP